MADYNINANITANTRGYEAGIQRVQRSTRTFSQTLSGVIQGLGRNGLVGALGAVGLATSGVTATLGAVVKIAKQVSQAIGECTEKYKTQIIAERQLATAVKNNPLITGKAVDRLKEYASQLQKVSNYGDEQLIPMMSDLIAKGRTEEETMQIMAVALDMSASGAMSLDTAITQLNATLNGNVGRLGQQNAELKGLTEEELKNGKAVEILGDKYKGLASATIDTSKQLKNIKGDFQEAIGQFTLPTSDMWNKFWSGFYSKGIEVIKQFDDYLDKTIIGKNIASTLSAEVKKISDPRQRRLYSEDEIHLLSDTQLKALESYLSSLKNLNAEEKILLQVAKDETEARVYLNKLYDDMDREEAQRQNAINKQKEAENEIVKLKEDYLQKVAQQEEKWKNIEAVTGEAVTNEEKIKFYQDSLVDLLTQSGGQITTNNQLYKDQKAIIDKLAEGLEKQKQALVDIASWEMKIRQQSINALSAETSETVDYEKKKINLKEILSLNLQNLQAQQEAELKSVEDTENAEEAKTKILEYYNNEKLALQKDYNEQIADIQREQEEEAWRLQKEQYQKMAKVVLSYAQQIESAFKNVASKIAGAFKGIVGSVKSILSKMLQNGIDSTLDALLVIEDKILTFFVETLPKLPQFFKSAMQSIYVLLENVLSIVTPEKVASVITQVMQTITQYAPLVIGAIGDILNNMLDGIIDSLPDIVKALEIIVSKLGQILPQLIQKLIEVFIGILQNPKEIAGLVVAIIKGVVEIFNVLIKNIGPLLEALLPAIGTIIIELIKAIPDILASMGSAFWEAIKGIGKFVVNTLIDVLNVMLDGISSVWTWIPGTKGIPHIPKLAKGTQSAYSGLTLVGEAGPELVNFRGGEQVLNNRNTNKALASMGGNTNNFNVTFNNLTDTSAYAMMSQLKAYNRQMAINGVI